MRLTDDARRLLAEARKIVVAGTHQLLGDNYGIKNFFLPVFLNIMNDDTEHAAAYGLMTTLLNLVTIAGVSTLFQLPSKMSALFSELNATQDEDEKEIVTKKIISLIRSACVYGVVITPPLILPLFFSGSLLHSIFGQPSELANIAQSFLRPYSLFLIPTIFTIIFSGIMIGSGHTKTFLIGSGILAASLVATAISSFQKNTTFNAGMSRLLTFFITESYASAFLYFFYIFFHKDYAQLNLRKKFFGEFSVDWPSFKALLKDGFSLTLRITCDYLFPFILIHICAKLPNNPEESQAAFALASQPQWLNSLINIFFALAAAKYFSNAKDDSTVNKNLFIKMACVGIGVTAIASSIIPIIFLSSPRMPGRVFGNNNSIVLNTLDKISTPIALASWLDSFCFTLMFQAQSGWNAFGIGCVARFVGLIIGLAASAFFAFTMNWGAQGLAWGFPVGMIPTILLLIEEYFHGINKISHEKETRKHGRLFHSPDDGNFTRTAYTLINEVEPVSASNSRRISE